MPPSWITYLSLLSIPIALVSASVLLVSYKRTKRLEDYKSKTRIDLSFSYKKLEDRLEVTLFLENMGTMPTDIKKLVVEIGADEKNKESRKVLVIGRSFVLSPGKPKTIEFTLTTELKEEILEKYNLEQCTVFCCASYLEPNGEIAEASRLILIVRDKSVMSFGKDGGILLPHV